MTKKKVKFITMGCRVNQYETQGMREILGAAGFEEPDPACRNSEEAEYVVINTCTVTQEADREARYWVRRARRENPNARIIVTGCGVKKQELLKSLPEIDGILPNHAKDKILENFESPESFEAPKDRFRYGHLKVSRSEGKTRAWVKIQDGCNHACSFCKVVLVRGRSRSRSLEDVIGEVQRLRDSGYQDIVFGGIQLGAYGHDIETKGKAVLLPEVIRRVSEIQGITRIRLSSIEPTDVTGDLIKALRSTSSFAPHLHIPLQSGSDEILKRMNRRYDAGRYCDLIDQLRKAIPDFNLTLDVMAGFPGEETSHFNETLAVLKRVQPLKCHVFPFSPREGTRAAQFPNQVPSDVKRERVRILNRLSDEWGIDVMKSYLGRKLPVLIESKEEITKDGRAWLQGLTANFMKVKFLGKPEGTGKIVTLTMESIKQGMLVGSVSPEELWKE